MSNQRLTVVRGRSELAASEQLVAEWERDQYRRGLADSGIKRMAKLFRNFDRSLRGRHILEATEHDINAFLDGRRIIPATRSSYLSWLSSLYGWAVRNELTRANPVDRIQRPRRGKQIPRPLGAVQVEIAMTAPCDPRMRAWLALAGWAGLRAQEIATLSREDLCEGADPPILRVSYGKGNKERILPLNPDLWAALVAYGLPRSGWLFPHTDDPSRHIMPWSVTHKCGAHLKAIGTDGHLHQLRHSFATEAYRRSKDLRLVQHLLGHASPTTTAGYTQLVPSAETTAVVMGISRPQRPAASFQPRLPF